MILCNGMYKCGTHLLMKACEVAGLKRNPAIPGADTNGKLDTVSPDNFYQQGHLAFCELPGSVKTHLLILRDPRTALASLARWRLERLGWVGAETARQQMLGLLRNTYRRGPWVGVYWQFLPWLERDDVEVFRYEDLMEPSLQEAWNSVMSSEVVPENDAWQRLRKALDFDGTFENVIGGTKTFHEKPTYWGDWFDGVEDAWKASGGPELELAVRKALDGR